MSYEIILESEDKQMTQVEKLTRVIEGIADFDQKTPQQIAEELVSSGASIQTVRLGQTMWAYLDKQIRSCVVDTVICLGEDTHEDCIFVVKTANGVSATYKVRDIGACVFESQEQANVALAELVKQNDENETS